MKLYYKPGACSLASHIVLREVGADFELERVDTGAQKTESGADFTRINPKGYVPVLHLDDGQILTEGAAILQYLADRKPEARLAPPAGSLERARLQEHLNYTASELHKAFSPFFAPSVTDTEKEAAKAKVIKRMDYFESVFADGREYLLGDRFSVADAYFFVVANWTKPTGIGLDRWPKVAAHATRVMGREKVKEAMRAEGILK